VTSRDGGGGEVKLRGTCSEERDPSVQSRYAEAVSSALGWEPEIGRFHLFSVEIGSVSFLRYDDATGDQYVVLWPQGEEFVRRGTSATSLGDVEPSANEYTSG
jgi:hypothetical protein